MCEARKREEIDAYPRERSSSIDFGGDFLLGLEEYGFSEGVQGSRVDLRTWRVFLDRFRELRGLQFVSLEQRVAN